jgi:hypothetical protein
LPRSYRFNQHFLMFKMIHKAHNAFSCASNLIVSITTVSSVLNLRWASGGFQSQNIWSSQIVSAIG